MVRDKTTIIKQQISPLYKSKIWTIFSFQTAHNTVVMKSNIYTVVVQNSFSTTKHIYNNLLLPLYAIRVSTHKIYCRHDRQQLRLWQPAHPWLRDLLGGERCCVALQHHRGRGVHCALVQGQPWSTLLHVSSPISPHHWCIHVNWMWHNN